MYNNLLQNNYINNIRLELNNSDIIKNTNFFFFNLNEDIKKFIKNKKIIIDYFCNNTGIYNKIILFSFDSYNNSIELGNYLKQNKYDNIILKTRIPYNKYTIQISDIIYIEFLELYKYKDKNIYDIFKIKDNNIPILLKLINLYDKIIDINEYKFWDIYSNNISKNINKYIQNFNNKYIGGNDLSSIISFKQLEEIKIDFIENYLSNYKNNKYILLAPWSNYLINKYGGNQTNLIDKDIKGIKINKSSKIKYYIEPIYLISDNTLDYNISKFSKLFKSVYNINITINKKKLYIPGELKQEKVEFIVNIQKDNRVIRKRILIIYNKINYNVLPYLNLIDLNSNFSKSNSLNNINIATYEVTLYYLLIEIWLIFLESLDSNKFILYNKFFIINFNNKILKKNIYTKYIGINNTNYLKNKCNFLPRLYKTISF
tara:strand:- start:2395 stop:3684 length:1290 start_codon:yes stop_codon:yes gene_type:complete